MAEFIKVIDECLLYSLNFDYSHFIYFFFGKTKITQYDMYIIEQVKLLRNDFVKFWLNLDDSNKNKFINIVMDNNSTYPKIKIPSNIILF